jgi:hypothetical protein
VRHSSVAHQTDAGGPFGLQSEFIRGGKRCRSLQSDVYPAWLIVDVSLAAVAAGSTITARQR